MVKFFTGALTMFTLCITVMWIGHYVSVFHGLVLALLWLLTGAMGTIILILPKVDDR